MLLLAACAAQRSEAPAYPEEKLVAGAPPAPQAAAADVFYESEESTSSFGESSNFQQTQRLVIKNADLSIVVDDPAQSMNTISSMAEEMGGFVVSAQLYHSYLENGAEVPRASITIRVPAEQLDEALERIRSQSERSPLNENINSQDVTSDYTDLQSRLRNLEAAEEQLTEIMGSATKTEDVLSVYNQLVQVREQIEVIKGQIQYYDQSVALSAISVDLVANEAVQPLSIGGWQPVGVAKDAIQALINTLKFLVNFIIWFVIYALPTLLILYIIIFLPLSWLWRTLRRRRKRRKQDAGGIPPTPPTENSL